MRTVFVVAVYMIGTLGLLFLVKPLLKADPKPAMDEVPPPIHFKCRQYTKEAYVCRIQKEK